MALPTEHLGCVPYEPTWQAMRAFTQARDAATPDALWLCEHPPVFTLGVAGDDAHVLTPGDIPVVRTDRGGQVTYHGPGQVVAYPLLDLRRAGIYVKEYVFRLEEAAIRTLADFGVVGHRVRGAPGIYVRPQEPGAHARLPEGFSAAQLGTGCGLAKIAALGIKVRGHCTYHGLALNVAMDLAPYGRIHPCGYAGLPSTDLASLGVPAGWAEVAQALSHHLAALLGENGT